MFDGLNDDDDAFFTPVPSSNLASLFGVSVTQAKVSSTNTTLTYTAPKQPSSKTDEIIKNSKSKHQSSVILFKEVHAFKLVEKNYSNQGKCGLALIGNDVVHVYQLLLYKQKNDIISTTKVCNQLQFIIQKDNYASYYDDQKQNWTIRFNSEVDLNDFSATLESRGGKLVKVNENEISNSESLKSMVSKDVSFDKETLKQIDSDNQSDTSSNNVKATILSRMAKMGQKLLPNTSISDGTDSDTEREKSLQNKNRKFKRGNANTSPTLGTSSMSEIAKKPINVSPSRSNTVSVSSQPYLQPITQQYAIINGQPVPIVRETSNACHTVLPVETVPSSPVMYTQVMPQSSELFQMYFAENRTHNSEVRMNILRLTNKMEEVLEKVQKIDTSHEKSATNESKDDTLKEENENLKSRIKKLEYDIDLNKEADRKRSEEFLEKEQVLYTEINELKKEIEKHVANENEYHQNILKLETKLKEYEDTSLNTKANGNKLADERNELLEESVKKIMNSLYHEIHDQIQEDEAIQGKDVKRILAQKIVDNTYNIISAVNELSLSK